MDKPYNNRTEKENSHHIGGLLKLDTMGGVDDTTFGMSGLALDLRSLKENLLEEYKGNNKLVTNHLSIAYFSTDNIEGIDKNNEADVNDKIKKIIAKINDNSAHFFSYNVYVDGIKKDNLAVETANGSKTPRTLEEFEYYGNNGKFKTSAYDSYKGNFDGVNPDVKQELEKDKDSGLNKIP